MVVVIEPLHLDAQQPGEGCCESPSRLPGYCFLPVGHAESSYHATRLRTREPNGTGTVTSCTYFWLDAEQQARLVASRRSLAS
jgi:hypothetical protein